ncbi:hypothetical protein DIZ27_09275 [Streptomyces sp. NWU339]|uniref:hypothetical protein n=1 Tax=Streptomyces sp. NWU339 TaxID=2185284 RepID=UPI000D67533D|nr:hypothetical protein [Streptomyces sp. NWU339]PWI11035.1 hypothetical protein DIZ27_09275 [Streptomyces sp. NWU339]
MARHDAPKKPTVRRALATLAAAGAVLGVGATAAAAADSGSPLDLTGAAGHAVGPVAGLKPNPLAGTGVDPLDNGVRTQVADFEPVDSRTVTGPVAQAPSVDGVPVVGRAAGALGG